jgi:hypothetical protein
MITDAKRKGNHERGKPPLRAFLNGCGICKTNVLIGKSVNFIMMKLHWLLHNIPSDFLILARIEPNV